MLFVGTILIAAGYTLLYAAVEGDNYAVGGVPVWRRPWLPFVDIFSGRALTGGQGPAVGTANPGDALAAAVSGAPSSTVLAGQPSTGLANPTPVPPGPPPGAGGFTVPPGSFVL